MKPNHPDLANRYERLREQRVSGGRPSMEQAYFIQYGMAGWIKKWATYLSFSPAHIPAKETSAIAINGKGDLGAVTQVLTSMVLSLL